MDAQRFTTLRAGPFLMFFFHERLNTCFADIVEISYHAHPVLGPVTDIHATQGFAGKIAAAGAVIAAASGPLAAVPDFALEAGFRLHAIIAPASVTRVAASSVGAAEAAIHAARCYQICSCFSCTSVRHNIGFVNIVCH